MRNALGCLVGLLVVTGAFIGLSRGAAALHAAAAAALLVAVVGCVAYAYARASYREHPWRWLALVTGLGLIAALYGTGAGLLPGEAGAEGRAHMGAALGAPAPDWAWVATAHVALALLLAFGVWWFSRPARDHAREPALSWRARLGIGAAVVALPSAAALAWPDAAALPQVDGAEAARAPWAVRPLEPIEAELGVAAAFALALVPLAVIALSPLLDRGERPAWTRWVVSATLVGVVLGYVALALYGGFLPPEDHLHGAEVAP